MKRITALLLAAALSGPAARATEPLPTTPQVPAPVIQADASGVASGHGDRVLTPVRERTGLAMPTGRMIGGCESCDTAACGGSVIGGSPIKELFGHAAAGASAPCGSSVCPGSPIKSWLCFYPTTGKALPKLNPAPYVGPVTGQFPCQSAAGCAGGGCANGKAGFFGPGCGSGSGCGPGSGCGLRSGLGHGDGLLGRKGCGVCTLLPEGSFPGYRFAVPESAALVDRSGLPPVQLNTGYSQKPAVPPTGLASGPPAAKTAAPQSPTALEALKRSFARP